MTEAAIDVTAVEEGAELVPHEQPSTTLFRTNDPGEVLKRATEAATALKAAIDAAGLVSNIQGREYVRVEGWTTLASMLGVTPVCEWTREIEGGWEARVVAQTLDGRTIGAAEAQCTREERTWKTRDPFALRSMAQTRATAKSLRAPLGFVVTLAGYEATPAEEMTQVAHEAGQGTDPALQPISEPQANRAKKMAHRAGKTNVMIAEALKGMGYEKWSEIKRGAYDEVVAQLVSKEPIRTGESDIPADLAGLEPSGDTDETIGGDE